MSTSSIVARDVTQVFRRGKAKEPLLALDTVNLEIPAGSFVSLIGTSGCGKSTLLRIFAGLVEPTVGDVLVDGNAVRSTDANRGMVFQQDAVFPWLSVAENIMYGLRARGVAKDAARAQAVEWARQVGLGGFEDAMPKELSGGMRKRVDIARVYANEPAILLMDEPFGALDAQTKERMQSDLLDLWEQNPRTVVFVTHDLDEAIYVSDFIVVMSARPGRIKEIHRVDLPRPRTPELRLTEEFLNTKRELHAQIGESR